MLNEIQLYFENQYLFAVQIIIDFIKTLEFAVLLHLPSENIKLSFFS